jgi:hypothetical protein
LEATFGQPFEASTDPVNTSAQAALAPLQQLCWITAGSHQAQFLGSTRLLHVYIASEGVAKALVLLVPRETHPARVGQQMSLLLAIVGMNLQGRPPVWQAPAIEQALPNKRLPRSGFLVHLVPLVKIMRWCASFCLGLVKYC